MRQILFFFSGIFSWDYENFNDWPESCQNGKAQSPINIDSKTVIKFSDKHDDLNASDIYPAGLVREATVTTQHLQLHFTFEQPVVIKGHLCPQIHFHFNQSEHTFDRLHSFGESHLVCHSDDYDSFDAANASGELNAVHVFSVLIESGSEKDNADFQQVIDAKELSKAEIPITKPTNTCTVIRYQGSLTTPNCDEPVTWSIFKEKTSISENQVDQILAWNDGTVNNNRPVQNLNNREIYEYSNAELFNVGVLVLAVLCL